jgi:hypothetical protein
VVAVVVQVLRVEMEFSVWEQVEGVRGHQVVLMELKKGMRVVVVVGTDGELHQLVLVLVVQGVVALVQVMDQIQLQGLLTPEEREEGVQTTTEHSERLHQVDLE